MSADAEARLDTPNEHALKTHPEPFAALLDGSKPFEFRCDDREPPFAVGDILWLQEWDPATGEHTGRYQRRVVSYILRGAFGVPDGYAVLGFAERAEADAKRLREALERCAPFIERIFSFGLRQAVNDMEVNCNAKPGSRLDEVRSVVRRALSGQPSDSGERETNQGGHSEAQ